MKIQWTYEQSMKSSNHSIKNNSADEKKIMKDSAVSEVIGVMLLLGAVMTLSVVFASTAGVLVSDTDSPVNAEIIYVGDDGTDYIFEAASGDGAAASDLKIVYGLREDNTKYDSCDVSSSYGFIETGERFSISMPSFPINNGQHVIYKFYDTKTGKKISTGEIYINKPTPTPTPVLITVTFNPNGGSGSMSPQTFTYGKAKELSPNTFTREGYTFKGWNNTTSPVTEPVYKDKDSITITKDVTLYAMWEINTYNVTFDPNGGIGTMEDQIFTYGERKNLSPNTFTRDGYRFAGWNNTTSPVTEPVYKDKENITITKDVILYAVWIKPIEDDYGKGYLHGINEYLNEYLKELKEKYPFYYSIKSQGITQWVTEYINGFTENYQGCEGSYDQGSIDGKTDIKDYINWAWLLYDGYAKGSERAEKINQN